MKRLICWWLGHQIKADILLAPEGGHKFAFYCERCNCRLPGPRP